MVSHHRFTVFTLLVFVMFSHSQVLAAIKHDPSPFESALDTLQKQIGYTFKKIGYLRRAMTHASFSGENNRALSVLGANVMDTSVSLHALSKNIDISPVDIALQIAEISTSCAADGMLLGLEKVIRVSSNTNASTPSVICGAFRSIFGAIAIDTNNSDDAGSVFWRVHGGGVGKAAAL